MGAEDHMQRISDGRLAVDGWNQTHAVGIAVAYRDDLKRSVITATRTPAAVLGSHTAVIWLEGISGCVALDRVSPITRVVESVQNGN